MSRYSDDIKEKARQLRMLGKTYTEINEILKLKIPKSTLSDWSKNTKLPDSYSSKIVDLNLNSLNKARLVAFESNRIKREEFIKRITKVNIPISKRIGSKQTAKIALAMLCLGEASKSTSRTSFYFGNSDPKIITLFLKLMERCFDFKLEKIRCTVQCRADQNIRALERFWMDITKIPKNQFYKSRIDPRTIGKITKKKEYKGVLRVDYFDTKVRHELESLSNLIYNHLIIEGR